MKVSKLLLLLCVIVAFGCSKDELTKIESSEEYVNSEKITSISSRQVVRWGEEEISKLENLTSYVGYLLKQPEVRHELFESAQSEFGAVSLCLDKVLSDGAAGTSTLATAFYDKNNEKLFNIQELADFAMDNRVMITAPYLAENFSPDFNSVTMTYYYPSMYKDRDEDSSFMGETPGMYIENLKEYHPFRTTNNARGKEGPYKLKVNDDYATRNPAVVVKVPPLDLDPCGYSNNPNPPTPNPNPPVSFDPLCTELSEDYGTILEVEMPQFALQGNIRRWPNANYISCWIATGEFTVGNDGKPKLNANLNYVLHEYRVSRRRARKKKWLNTNLSFIIHNWKYESQNMYIVWGSRDSRKRLDVEASVSAKINDLENPEIKFTTKPVNKGGTTLISGMSVDKCALLSDIHYKNNKGYGLRDNSPVYSFGRVKTFFKVKYYE